MTPADATIALARFRYEAPPGTYTTASLARILRVSRRAMLAGMLLVGEQTRPRYDS